MDKLIPSLPTPLQLLTNDAIAAAGISVYMKRDDLIHPEVSGNKWRKLKYNLIDAMAQGRQALLTFGGAYSNHLYATAAAGHALGLSTIGIVRGEELADQLSSTLKYCQKMGMRLHFVSRQEYRLRNDPDYLSEMTGRFGMPYIIPEGGTTTLALKGVGELTVEVAEQLGFNPTYYATAAGTGGTAAGILSTGNDVLAFSALKGGNFLADDIAGLLSNTNYKGHLTMMTEYHFGGYAKHTPELLSFITDFHRQQGIQLEQVYTAKMMYGLFDLINQGFFKQGETVVAVHTGGLQGLLPEVRF